MDMLNTMYKNVRKVLITIIVWITSPTRKSFSPIIIKIIKNFNTFLILCDAVIFVIVDSFVIVVLNSSVAGRETRGLVKLLIN